jgi:hypothetical protein
MGGWGFLRRDGDAIKHARHEPSRLQCIFTAS